MSSDRPRKRADCVDGPRPCPFISCRYHILADVSPAGTLFVTGVGARPLSRRRVHLPDALFEERAAEAIANADGDTCALDVAARGPVVLERVGELVGVTRERARQVESAGLIKLKRKRAMRALADDE